MYLIIIYLILLYLVKIFNLKHIKITVLKHFENYNGSLIYFPIFN